MSNLKNKLYKKCTKCGKTKLLSEYHKNKKYKGDHITHCKECKNAITNKWKKDNPDKVLAYSKNRVKNGETAKSSKRYYMNHKEECKIRQQKYQKEHSDQRRAVKKVQYALKKGNIIKKNCVVCGSKETEAHHEDYLKPLDVIWLCHLHHMELHQRKKDNV